MSKKDLIHELVKMLEQLEDKLDWTAFYPYDKFLISHHFCPAFDYKKEYFEIQYDDFNELQVVSFGFKGYKQVGDELTEEEIREIIENLKKL